MNKLYSLDILQEIAQGDDAFVQDMITTFIDNVSGEAENIRKLMDAGEWQSVGGIAHKLAPNYAYMDSESLYKLAAEIEMKIKNGSDLTEITELTRKMYADTLVLIDELKKTFKLT